MKKVILLLAAVFLFGCTNPDNGTGKGTGKLPGKFSATVLSDAMGSNARGISLGTYTVANSKSIFFILRNVGDFPITNITLTPGKLNKDGGAFVPITDNGITASPGTIGVLETSGNTSVETVIEVDINHGNVVGLISQQYIQKADFAGATLRITGKTTDAEEAVLDISLDADIETLIKVCSFELRYSDDGGNTYKKAEYGMVPTDEGVISFLIPKAGRNHISIVNTGNMPLQYKVWKNSESSLTWENYNDWVPLGAGSPSAALSYKYTGDGSTNRFVINTLGVAFDNGGMEDLAFRQNSSVVISHFNTALPAILFHIPY